MFLNEFEKWRMRQNPITSRIQVGGRQMPSWFSASLIRDGARRPSEVLQQPPPPPPNVPPPQEESEYEEIDHLPRYTNTNIKKPTATKKTCSLCGNGNPVVRCELCNNQIFCGSCNDMYHRHPKRHNHVRKILETVENRPPLPPKIMTPPIPSIPDAPIPPPRRVKKFGIRSATSSPTLMRKVFFDPMGSLKRQFGNGNGVGMEQRPLPPPPKPAPPLPPKSDVSRLMDGRQRQNSGPLHPQHHQQQQQHFQNSHHPTASQSQLNRNVPMTALEMASQRRNLMSREDIMQSPWDDFNGRQFSGSDTMRPRAQSVSTNQLNRFNSSSNISHIATLQRKPKRPIVCGPVRPPPPPIPPREAPPSPSLHSHHPNGRGHHSIISASAFNLNQLSNDMDFEDQQMGMGMTSPWMSPYPLGYQQQHHQQQHQHPHQQQMMFYPGNNGHGHGYPGGQMKRTPSTSSMTAGERQQPMFNPWSTMRNNQMTSSERELEMIGAGRRGSETRLDRDRDRDRDRPPPYGNQMQMQMQMQMSPRNQNNAGGHQGHAPNQNRSHFLDSADEFNLMNLNRDRSMSPSARIRQERELFQFELQRRESMSRESNPRERERDRDRDRDRRERSGSTAGGTTVVDGYWTCEWCTLINSVESNICSACCKTSTLVRQLKQEELDLEPELPVAVQSPISSPPPPKSRSSRHPSPAPAPAPAPAKKKVSGGKGAVNEGSSGKKSSNPAPIVHSVLSFSRNDKENKTSARLEKQIIKMVDDDEASGSGSGSDEEDDEGPGDTDSESQGSEPDSEENDEDDSDEDEDEDEEVEVVPSPVPVPVSMVVHVSPNVHANAHTNHRDNFRTGNHAHRKKSMSRERRPKTPLTSSNEEVYGSIPLQTLTIATTPSGTSTVFSGSSSSSSNKRDRDRDVKEPKKQQVSTGVGSSPPSPAPKYLSGNLKKETYTRTATTTTATEDSDRDYSRNGVNKSSSQASSEGSSSPTKPIKMKPALKKMSSVESSASNKSKSGPNSKSTGATSTATTMTTAGTSTSTSTSMQDLSIISPALTVAVGVGVGVGTGTGTGNGTALVETSSKATSLMKTSKGTSPPPQSISTQTYEELPAGKLELKSVSKTSLVAAIDLLDQEELVPSGGGGRTVKEMSDKELRYSRRSQQQSKLKRSMSTHLTSAVSGDPWMEANEGRHLYRSSSRHSLASDTRSLPLSGPPSRDASPPRGRFYQDFRAYPPPSWDRFPNPADYFASIEDLVNRRRKDSSRNQEFELARLLKEAAESGFTPEDVQVALRMCGERNPIKWLQDNWSNMVETVQTLATKYGREKGDERNEVGTISTAEAKEALRQHRGNVWVAVTECVEQRRKKFLELQARGNFLREDILTSLTANHGKLDSAYVELSKAQLKPFLMQIWGPPIGLDNEAAPPKRYSSPSTSSSTASSFSPNSESGVSNNSDNGKQQQQQQQQPQQPLQQNQNQLIEQEVDNSKLYEEVNPTNPGTNANLNAKEAQPSPSLGQLMDQNRDEEQNVGKQVGTRTQQPDYVRSNSLSEDQSDEHFMDATEGEGMIAITIDENLTESEAKEDIGSSSDQEESEAFVSDFLQNFQINRNAVPNNKTSKTAHPTPTPDVLSSSTSVIPTDIGIIDTTEDSIYAPHSVSQSQNEIPGGSGRRMTDPAPSAFGNEGMLGAVGQGASFKTPIQLNPSTTSTTEGAEKLVENKLHFSMEAVLELLEQQRIKIMKEAEVEKNKELYATTSAASGPGTTSTMANLAETTPLPTSTLEPLSSSNVKVGQEKTLKENFEGKPKERGVGKKQSLNPVPTSKKDINPAEGNEKNGADGIMRNTASTTGSGKNVRSQVLHAQGSVESTDSIEAEFEGETDVDASIYEEVDNGDNLSLTEYINRAMVPQDDDEDMDDESMEDETSIGDDEDADLSIESSGSIETHSDMDPDELLEEIYVQQQPQPSDLDLEPFAPESTEVAGEIQQVAAAAAVAQEKAETKPLPSPTPTPAPAPAPVEEPVVVKVVKEVKPEVKRLMDEGLSECFEHAELAVQLMDMKFTEEDSVHAAKECNSIYQALSYLQQECLLCTGKFSATHMISMLRCTHWCCKTCARDYFMVQIRDHGILDATCPFCKEPSQQQLLEDPDVAVDYFNHLDILLKNLLDYKHHEMFQRKLRDYTLSNTPNFKWCSKCSSGFITEPMQTRLVCPDCSAVTCAVCLEPWDRTHDHRDQNTVKLCDDATKSIVDYLNENCVECPRCRLKFFLARGGCMHLTCSQCKFEFCSGCSAPFRLSTKCNDGPFCLKLGLHAHHPRNCLFYLRDKDPPFLAKLLEDHAIPYLSEDVIEESQTERRRRCRVSIQKETEAGLQDDICGNDAPPGFATVCQGHYIEYLGLLIWQNRLDPISILSNDDLETILKRAHKKTPHRLHGTKDADFRVKLLQVIQDEIPL